MRSNVKVYLQDSITVDKFPTLHLIVTKLGWYALYWPPWECAQVGETHYGYRLFFFKECFFHNVRRLPTPKTGYIPNSPASFYHYDLYPIWYFTACMQPSLPLTLELPAHPTPPLHMAPTSVLCAAVNILLRNRFSVYICKAIIMFPFSKCSIGILPVILMNIMYSLEIPFKNNIECLFFSSSSSCAPATTFCHNAHATNYFPINRKKASCP